jgi:hypothetical protein
MMLSFYCTDCKETIPCPDSEGPDQVFDRLDKHTEECALATFTFQGTTDLARKRANDLRAIIASGRVTSKLRLH